MWLRLQLGKGPALLLGATVGATIELGGTVHAVGWLRGGMKHQLKPNAAKENMDKLKYQADSTYVTIEAKHADAQRHADRKNVVCLTNHEDALGIDANTGTNMSRKFAILRLLISTQRITEIHDGQLDQRCHRPRHHRPRPRQICLFFFVAGKIRPRWRASASWAALKSLSKRSISIHVRHCTARAT